MASSITDLSGLRVALADIEVGDMVVKKGDAVVVSTAAANWDDSVFPQPENLDFDRDARHHLAFGHGIHRCIAQNLARVELEIVFNTMFARVPGLRLAAPRRGTVLQGWRAPLRYPHIARHLVRVRKCGHRPDISQCL
ncbi:cytochrome P450 [Kutzneria sp. CA-103260]|uniref:cytochrome P450 n=1 Tax=Kutzneria sp. CA-103260 TaxID=2802641 RepID=UPI001BA7D083|nr:cytochrome P450 [Kutzneria sp. CA-103260]QUQ64461.1 Cytochrome P450 [Kutzneria sp. CA-103260]